MNTAPAPTAHDHLCACGRRVMVHTTALPCNDRHGVCRDCKGTAKVLVARRLLGVKGAKATRLG